MITSTSVRPTNAMIPTAAPSAPNAPQFAEDPYDPAVIQRRTEAGRRAEQTADELPKDIVGRATPSYFRTYDQLKTAMFELQEKFPDLVEVRDIGDTWEKTQGIADRDVLALVLTNKNATGAKPSTVHVGGIHAREIANPELLMTFAQQLLTGHGRDAEATMLLDSRETVLVPMLNADGHAVVERGFEGARGGNLMKRKNTSGSDGVDLNRNYEYKWGGPGASSSPRSETYRGPSAGSEPETQAIQSYIREHKPAMLIDWHSYSKLNLFPWGDSREQTKDHQAYKAITEKFTTFNGYSPIQSVQLYPTSGTSNDHAYGVEGVAALAIETGSAFHQTDAEFAKTLRENLPVLTYAVKIADDPFKRVFGPDALDMVVDPTTKQVGATINGVSNGGQAIAGAELVLDAAAAPGTGIALQAADGKFDSPEEQVVGDATHLPGITEQAGDGTLVYVRGRDTEGNWGPLAAQWLTGPASAL
ncbi:MAG: M14 family metallopeptidase [Gaiellales bacterium]